jgi:hypothetical protein
MFSFSFSSSISETRRINPAVGSIDAVFFARTRFRLRRSENENDDEDDDEDDSRNEGERGALPLIGIPASRLLPRASWLRSVLKKQKRDALLTHWEGSSGSLSLLDNRS